MELRAYWKIIVRRWWLPVGLALLVAALTLAMQKPWQPRPVSYNAAMRFNVGITPERIPGVYTYDRYYTMLTSEYLVDDLGEIVRSQAFAAAVSARLADQGLVVPAGAIGANTQPGKLHRILTVNVGGATRLSFAPSLKPSRPPSPRAALNSSANSAQTKRTSGSSTRRPSARSASRARQQLDLPLRALLALAAGIALAFLWHYLDTTVRERAELEQMGLTVLGEIPRH